MKPAPLPEDGPPCVAPRETPAMRGELLRFPGGAVDTSGFVESHHGPTPSTVADRTKRREMATMFLEMGRRDVENALNAGSLEWRDIHARNAKAAIENAVIWLKGSE